MRYALAALLILFMSSCQTVTHSECVDAKKVLEAARDKVNAVTDADMRLFRLSERERKAFLSNQFHPPDHQPQLAVHLRSGLQKAPQCFFDDR